MFGYNDCQSSLNTYVFENGDTIYQIQYSYNEKGLLKEIIEGRSLSKKPEYGYIKITVFYDYEYNEYGHWIRRKCISGLLDGIIWIEKRELTYY